MYYITTYIFVNLVSKDKLKTLKQILYNLVLKI